MEKQLEDYLEVNPVEKHSVSGRFQYNKNVQQDIQDRIIKLIIKTNKDNTNEWTFGNNWLSLVWINPLSSKKLEVAVENSIVRNSNDENELAKSFLNDLNQNLKKLNLETVISIENINKERIEFCFEFQNDIANVKDVVESQKDIIKEDIATLSQEKQTAYKNNNQNEWIKYSESGFKYDLYIRFKKEYRQKKLEEIYAIEDIKEFSFNAVHEEYFPKKNGYISMGLNLFDDNKEQRQAKVEKVLIKDIKGISLCVRLDKQKAN